MANSPKKPSFVSMNDLAKLVNIGVADAIERTKIKPSNDRLIMKWELVGRRVDRLKGAEKFASIVAERVSAGGVRVEPAVLILDKEILAGFYPVNVSIREFSL